MAAGQFRNMLNEVLNLQLMYNTYLRDTYIFRKAKDKDMSWRGGTYIVPFEGGEASAINFGGQVVPEGKVEQESFVRGSISDYKQVYGNLVFFYKDGQEHGKNSRVPRDTFYKQQMGKLMMKNKSRFQFLLSFNALNGRDFCAATAAGTSAGVIRVDYPQRLTIGQRVYVASSLSTPSPATPSEGWVKSININTGDINLVTTRNGSTNVDLSGFGSAAMAVIRLPGTESTDGGLTSLRSQILPSGNGGSANLFGQSKTDYPYLQSIAFDGSSISSRKSFVFALYDAIQNFVDYGQPYSSMAALGLLKETGKQSLMDRKYETVDIVMNLSWIGVLQKYFLEVRGDYFKSIPQGEKMVPLFDSKVFMLTGPDGNQYRVVGVKSMPADTIYILGENCLRLASNKFIDVVTGPDGDKWHPVRSDTLNRYWLCDYRFYGDLILKRPAGTAVIHSLPAVPTS